jgi:hypothetical protein
LTASERRGVAVRGDEHAHGARIDLAGAREQLDSALILACAVGGTSAIGPPWILSSASSLFVAVSTRNSRRR